MKKETWLPGEIYKNRKLVFSLAKNDFKTKYAGSYFGTVWAFIQPIVTICVTGLYSDWHFAMVRIKVFHLYFG